MKLFLRGSCVCIIIAIWVSGVPLSLVYGGARTQSGSRPQVRPKSTGPQRTGAGKSGNTKVSDAGASPVARMCQEGNKLFSDRIYFNGDCRRIDFFRRFLSKGAKLVGVAGPRSGDSDTGVVVIETDDKQEVPEIFVLPEKQKPGFTLSRGYQYRADYPVVAIHTYRTWKDPQGFVNQIAEFKGPTTIQRATGPSGIPARTTVFSTISWVHRIQTASGWEQISSDGTRTTASASSAGTSSYCNTAAAGVN